MKGGGVLEYFWNSIGKLAVRRIDFNFSPDRDLHDELSNLVKQMIDARHQESIVSHETKRDFWSRKCDSLDRQIDGLVYKLYDLTSAEIEIVEGGGRSAEAQESDD